VAIYAKPASTETMVKESTMEILVLVLALVVLGVAAQVYGWDSREQGEPRNP